MIRRPPRSPLFPYTPLSRSEPVRDRTADLAANGPQCARPCLAIAMLHAVAGKRARPEIGRGGRAVDPAEAIGVRKRSEEHTSELQSPCNLVCRLLLEKKKKR